MYLFMQISTIILTLHEQQCKPTILHFTGLGLLLCNMKRPKWPNTTIFGNFQQKNTVSEIHSKVPLFLELKFQKLEFLISFATVALLSWIYAIKKNFAVLELGKLEYHLHRTRVYQARVPFFKKKKKKLNSTRTYHFFFLVWG